MSYRTRENFHPSVGAWGLIRGAGGLLKRGGVEDGLRGWGGAWGGRTLGAYGEGMGHIFSRICHRFISLKEKLQVLTKAFVRIRFFAWLRFISGLVFR